ncbi:putative short chain dehydrogenase [Aspergillus lucknowensis]|uniref:Ketoreductase domain-containing protein n=1 Tax=Aspergillus lucknowensis TaxID=176173 RepID=A0ABR4LL92_9EURO
MANYTGKKAVIIGGTHGMGFATAQLLIKSGAEVLLTGRSQPPIDSAKAQLGDKAHVVQADITSLSNITKLVEDTKTAFGADPQIDFLFINAGYARLEPFTAVTEESFRRTVDTNLFGSFFAAQKFTPLIRDGGAIVITSSVSTKAGIPGMSVYSAAKAAVFSLVQTLGAELAGRKIRVNAVTPGYIKTPTMGVSGVSQEDLVAFEAEGSKITPLDRIGSAEEVAKAAVFLAFEATFTTGSEIYVDGGLINVRKDH